MNDIPATIQNAPSTNGHHTNGYHKKPTQETIARLPPHSIEAEEATLGSIFIDPDTYFEVASFLKPEMFYRVQNQWIYEAMQSLFNKRDPLDFITLADELRKRNQLEEAGGEAYLIGLMNAVPTSINAVYYGRLVESAYLRRKMIGAASTIANLAYDEREDIGEVLDRAEQALFTVSAAHVANSGNTIKQLSRTYLETMQARMDNPDKMMGVPTGISSIDKMMNGLQKGDLILLAGRPGMGKTAFMNHMALHAAVKHHKRVAMFNLEMNGESLLERMIAQAMGLDSQILRRGTMHPNQVSMFYEVVGRISESKIFIDDAPLLTPMVLRTKARRIYAEHGLDLLMVDYAGLMAVEGKNDNRVTVMTEISRSLKLLARELDVPLVCAAQLSRGVEQRGDKRPILSDLRDSGSLEQDSDIVMFLYRESYYSQSVMNEKETEINIAKHRNGATGVIRTEFDRTNGRFIDLADKPYLAPSPIRF